MAAWSGCYFDLLFVSLYIILTLLLQSNSAIAELVKQTWSNASSEFLVWLDVRWRLTVQNSTRAAQKFANPVEFSLFVYKYDSKHQPIFKVLTVEKESIKFHFVTYLFKTMNQSGGFGDCRSCWLSWCLCKIYTDTVDIVHWMYVGIMISVNLPTRS